MQSQKPTRLKGKALHKLYEEARQRDGEICIACGRWVQEGVPSHHIEYRSDGGGDTLDNFATLCENPECVHYQIHHGSLKKAVQILLKRLIGSHREV
jgi:hypothetical protein